MKEGYALTLRNRYFTAINSSSVKTVADRHKLAAYHNNHSDELSGGTKIDDLNDLEIAKIAGF